MIKKSSMDKEILCWNRYNYAVSSFCFEQVIQNSQKEEIIQSLIGEGKNRNL